MKNIKKQISIFLIILFVVGGGLYFKFVYAVTSNAIRDEVLKINDTIVKRKQEIVDLNKKIEEVRKNIDKKKNEARTLENQIQIISNRIYQTELDIEATEKDIETKGLEIETLELDIKDKERKIGDEKELIGSLVRKLRKVSNLGYFEVLLLNDNLSDFFAEISFLQNIEESLTDQVKDLQDLHKAIENRKVKIEEEKKNLEATKESLSGKKVVLRENQSAREVLATAAIKTARKLADDLSAILRQKESIDSEVFSLQAKIQEKLNTSDKFAFSGNIILSWPVPNQGIVTYFYDSDYPFRNFFEHTGLDIRTLRNGRPSSGLSVKASAPGIVVKTVRESIYGGNIVYIAHAGGITTVYMHLSQMLVGVGDEVSRGDIIAYSGGTPGLASSGRFTTGPHLHFEVRKNGIPVNPLAYLINF